MALELLGGAVAGELVKALKGLGENGASFGPVVKEIRYKLNAVIPLLKEIDELNVVLHLPKEETEKFRALMHKGKQLILKCSHVKVWNFNFLKIPFYTRKLRDLDTAIGSFMDVLLVQLARDQKKNLKMMNQMMEILCRLDVSIMPLVLIQHPWPFPLPPLNNKPVGLQQPLRNLKAKLLNNGDQILAVTGPGGIGKTILALNFCHDIEVRDIFQGKILYVHVSMRPNLKLIMKHIIESLRGIEWPDLQNDEVAFSCLALLLKQTCQKPMLIVLDDVWDEPESEYLLDKLSQMPCCKILITSRMDSFPRSCKSCYLEPFADFGDAIEPFQCRPASLKNASCYKLLPDEETLDKVIWGGDGLPRASEGTGRLLPWRSTSYWEDVERNFSRSDGQNEGINQTPCRSYQNPVGGNHWESNGGQCSRGRDRDDGNQNGSHNINHPAHPVCYHVGHVGADCSPSSPCLDPSVISSAFSPHLSALSVSILDEYSSSFSQA